MSVLTGMRFGGARSGRIHGYGYAIAFVVRDRERAMAALGPSPRASDVFSWFEDGQLERNNWQQIHVECMRDGVELLVSEEYVYGIYNLSDLFGARRMLGHFKIVGDRPNRLDVRGLQSTDNYAAVVKKPDLDEEGYCYTKLFQAKFSYRLAEAFGKFPKVSVLLKSVNPSWMQSPAELNTLKLRVRDDIAHIDDVEGVPLCDVDWTQYSHCVIGGTSMYADQVAFSELHAACKLQQTCGYCRAQTRGLHVGEWNYDATGSAFAVPPDIHVQQRIRFREILAGEQRYKRGLGKMTVGVVVGDSVGVSRQTMPLLIDSSKLQTGGYAYPLQGTASLTESVTHYHFPDLGRHVVAYFPVGSVLTVHGVTVTAVTGPIALVLHGTVKLSVAGLAVDHVWCVMRDYAHGMRWNHRVAKFDFSSAPARLWQRVGLPPLFTALDQSTVMSVHLARVTERAKPAVVQGEKLWGCVDGSGEYARVGVRRDVAFEGFLRDLPKPATAEVYEYSGYTGSYYSDTGWLPQTSFGCAFVNCARAEQHSTNLWLGNICVARHKTAFLLTSSYMHDDKENSVPMLLEKNLHGSGSVLALTSYDMYDLDDGGLSDCDGWFDSVLCH